MNKKRCKIVSRDSCSAKISRLFNTKNKSQISIFIILGLMFVLLVVLFLFTTNILASNNELFFQNNLETNFDKKSLNSLVDYCFANFSNNFIQELANNGGTLNQTEISLHSKKYNGNYYRYLCVYIEGSEYCVNRVLTLNDMELELNRVFEEKMITCLNFSFLGYKGYTVETGNLSIESSIANKEVNYILRYPIKLHKGDITVEEKEFYYSQISDLGTVHKLVLDIINSETTFGFFDKDKWMNKNNILFEIEKSRPYPFVTYEIKSYDDSNSLRIKKKVDLNFKFSIEKEDKASGNSNEYGYDSEYGCCYINSEGSCYKNADGTSCQEKKGSYVNSVNCECNEHFITLNNLGAKNVKSNCGDHKDSESWCESIIGTGGRALKYSCHDGEIFEEACEDFNGEVCIEYLSNSKKTAECKINRWEDCAKCTTQNCCENDLYRDCLWNENSYDVISESRTIECIPKQKPGFKFWEGSGQEVCNFGTGYARCSGSTCGQEWIDSVSTSCSNLGDCGIGYNYLNDFSNGGYLETDIKNPNYNLFNNKIQNFSRNKFSLNRDRLLLFNVANKDSLPLISSLLSVGLNYLDDVANNNKIILDYSFCGLWQAPTNGNCKKCGNDKIPCSEYSCHSIGDNCVYSEKDGYSECSEKIKSNQDIIIKLKTDIDYSVEKINIAGNEIIGYKINQVLPPFKLVDFIINTSVESKCKITYLPELNFAETPAIWFGDAEFSKEHMVSLRLPEKIDVPDELYDNLGVNSLQELFTLITDNDDVLKDVFDDDFLIVLERLHKLVDNREYLKELLNLTISGLDNNEYYTFIRCADREGNENKDPVFLWFKIVDKFIDDNDPVLVGSSPTNGSVVNSIYNLSIYLDEPTECKLDYNDKLYGAMQQTFDCKNSKLDVNGYGGGSYLCEIETDITSPFIRCIDNPPVVEKYSFNFIKGENSSPLTYYQDNSSIMLFEDDFYKQSDLRFNSNFNNEIYLPKDNSIYLINFILSDFENCKIGNNGFDYNLMYDMDCSDINETNEFYAYGKKNCTKLFVSGNYNVSVMCIGELPEKQNINSESFHLEFNDNNVLSIVSTFPENNQEIKDIYLDLGVVVDEDIEMNSVNCGYMLDDNKELIQLIPNGNYQFKKRIYGLDRENYKIWFVCNDKYGSLAYNSIDISMR